MLFFNEFVAQQPERVTHQPFNTHTQTHTQLKSVLAPGFTRVFLLISFVNVVICDIPEVNKALTLFFLTVSHGSSFTHHHTIHSFELDFNKKKTD